MKECKKHGLLAEENTIREKSKTAKNGIQIRCRLCKIERDRRWKENHREQHIASSTRWKINNKEHYNEWNRQDRLKYPEKHKEWSKIHRERYGAHKVTQDITSFFGITLEEYENLFKEHDNLCAICRKKETKKSRTEGKICRLAVDHCHDCDYNGIKGIRNIRGILCHECNTGLGKFKDNINLFEAAITYLKKHSCQ